MQHDLAALQVVADHHGEVPLRPPLESQVLKDQNGIARRHLAQEILETLHRDGQPSLAPGRRHDVRGQGPFPARRIDLGDETVGRLVEARPLEGHGQGGGPAVVVFLREEGNGCQLGPLRQKAGICDQT